MKTVLMVAEKPSLAKTIAGILSNNNMREVKVTGKSLYIWNGRFKSEQVIFKMTSVFGHVFSIDFDMEFNKRIDPSALFGAKIIRKDAMSKMRLPAFLKSLAENEGKGLDYLVLWLDCDKEGENICFEILDIVKRFFNDKTRINYFDFTGRGGNVNNFNRNKSVYRARFSSLSPGEIQYAFENLTDPNYLESRSVDARQELDLRIGCAFTRLQTAHMAKTMNTKEKIVVSFGPCQTPTLGFCVARDDFIKKFQSQTYWGIDVRVSLDNQATGNSYYSNFNRDQDTLKLYWDRGRIFDKEAINAFCLLVRGDINQGPPRALVKSMTANIKQCYPPLPLNTVQLLRIASSAFGHSPHHTMDLAEKLYTSGYISYPRTETSAYSAGFDFQSILNAARSVPHLSPAVNKIMAQGGPNQQNRFGGKDVGDHPPITPTPQILYSNSFDRDDGKKQIYDYIFTHFLATLMGNAKYLEYVTTFEINGELFKSEHRELLEAGFMEIMPWKLGENGLTNKSVNHQRTEFKEGMIYPVIKVETTEYQTKPPNLLTESELIKLMETHGIGTDASIPVHIKKIIDRNYVKIVGNTANRKNFKSSFQNNDFDNDQEGNTNSGGGKARYLMPTQLGIALVHGYEMIDAELVLPTMRAAMEKQLNLIANGGALYDNVVSHTLNNYVSKYRFFESNLGLISTRNIGSLTSNSPSNENGRGRSNSGNRSGFGRSSSTGFRSRNSSGGSFKGGRGGRGGGRGKVRGRRGGGKQSGAKEVTITARYNIAPPPVVTGSNGYVSAPIYNTERLKRFLE